MKVLEFTSTRGRRRRSPLFRPASTTGSGPDDGSRSGFFGGCPHGLHPSSVLLLLVRPGAPVRSKALASNSRPWRDGRGGWLKSSPTPKPSPRIALGMLLQEFSLAWSCPTPSHVRLSQTVRTLQLGREPRCSSSVRLWRSQSRSSQSAPP